MDPLLEEIADVASRWGAACCKVIGAMPKVAMMRSSRPTAGREMEGFTAQNYTGSARRRGEGASERGAVREGGESMRSAEWGSI